MPVAPRKWPGVRHPLAAWLLGVAFVFPSAAPAHSFQNPASDSAATQTEPAASPNGAEAGALAVAVDEAAPAKADRQRKLRLAILTGGLVAVTGLALVVLTILGGSATRRGLRRRPLAARALPAEQLPAGRFDDPDGDDLSPEEHGTADTHGGKGP